MTHIKNMKGEEPVTEIPSEDQDKRVLSHRSWGYIQLSSPNGGDGDMFLSDTKHQRRVRLEVGRANMHIGKYQDRTHMPTGRPFITVEMTEADMGRLVSRNSSYGGVPCTICRVDNELMPDCPPSDRFECMADEVKAEAAKVTEPLQVLEAILRELSEAVNKTGTLKKTEIRELVKKVQGQLATSSRTVSERLPFYLSMLAEHMDTVVADGKSSLDAHADAKARSLGISTDALHLSLPAGE